jgi:hypothetical protein
MPTIQDLWGFSMFMSGMSCVTLADPRKLLRNLQTSRNHFRRAKPFW